MTRGEKLALDSAKRNWTIIGAIENPKIIAISLMLTDRFERREVFRTATIKSNLNNGVMKTLIILADNIDYLKSLVFITVDSFDTDNATTLGKLGRFRITNKAEEEDMVDSTARTPVMIIATKECPPLTIDSLSEFKEYAELILRDHRYPYIKLPKQDDEKLIKGEDGMAWSSYGLAVSSEDVVDWAITWTAEHDREILFVNDKESWPDSAWAHLLMLIELQAPGLSVFTAGKSEACWPLDTAKQLFKRNKKGGCVYKCDVNYYLQNMLRNNVDPVDYAEWPGDENEGTPRKNEEEKKILELSNRNVVLACENKEKDIRIANLTTAVTTMASHNKELLSHLTALTLQDDKERRDGRQRNVVFRGNNWDVTNISEEVAEKIPTKDQAPNNVGRLLTPDEITKSISDEENDGASITRTILNEPAIIMSGTTADGKLGAQMRIFPKLMPKPTTKVEADNSPVKTTPETRDHGEAEPASKKIVMTIKQDKCIEETSVMRGIKVATGSSSSEEGTQRSADKKRELTRVNINGRGKTGPPRSELYNKLAAKGQAQAETELTGKPERLQSHDEGEECSLMETSMLRDTSKVSDFNLSDDVVIEEYEDVEVAKTEAELKQMGEKNGCGLSYICKDLENMLGGPENSSTPKLSNSSNATRSSMPPLVSASSSSPNPSLSSDSGMPGSDYQIRSDVFSPPVEDLASPVYSPFTSPTYSTEEVVTKNEKLGNYDSLTCLTTNSHRLPKESVTEDQIPLKARTSEAEPRVLNPDIGMIINFVKNQFIYALVPYAYMYRNLNRVTQTFPGVLTSKVIVP